MKSACQRGDLPTKAYGAESEGREANIMKRIGLWALGIGVLASVGLLTVEQGICRRRRAKVHPGDAQGAVSICRNSNDISTGFWGDGGVGRRGRRDFIFSMETAPARIM